MLYKPINSNYRKRHAALIYAVVFSSGYSMFLVLLLFASFFIQPIHQAYANEAAAEEVPVAEESPVADDVSPQEESPPEIIEEPLESADPPEEVSETPAIDDAETTVSDEVETTDVPTETESEPPVTPTYEDESIPEDADNEPEELITTSSQSDIETASSTEENASIEDELPKTPAATTTDTTAPTTAEETNPEDGDNISDETATSTDNTATSTADGNISGGSTGGGSDVDNTDSTGDEDDTDTSSDPVTDDSSDTESTEKNNGSDTSSSDTPTETSSSTDEVVESVETATTSEPAPDINFVEAQNLVTEDNFYQFNRQSCVAIGDGTYHCSVTEETGIDLNAVVYAELGNNANKEIFLRTSTGEVRQLTDNDFEDTAPHYNAESMQVVWQRQIDGRYQIILYDIAEDEEDQLTFSRTNNMEPKVSEEGIVWQAWDGNDWEIMYFDGQYTDQLTDNLTQDVAPAIDDGYVLWSVLGSDEQEARVYSLKSQEVLTINGYEGGMITNPRFVLVYDTMFDNGDVVTQGFDPNTGLSAPISAQPAENPVDIPDSDGTGETRALIQNKSSQKEDLVVDGTKDVTGSSSPNGVPGSGTTTDAVTDTLDLTQPTAATGTIAIDSISDTEATTTDQIIELTDFDLILLPTESTTTPEASTGTIPTTEE